jgi:hypothetical protein
MVTSGGIPGSALQSRFEPARAGFLTLVKPATENRGVVGSIPTLAIIGQSGLSGSEVPQVPQFSEPEVWTFSGDFGRYGQRQSPVGDRQRSGSKAGLGD